MRAFLPLLDGDAPLESQLDAIIVALAERARQGGLGLWPPLPRSAAAVTRLSRSSGCVTNQRKWAILLLPRWTQGCLYDVGVWFHVGPDILLTAKLCRKKIIVKTECFVGGWSWQNRLV